MATPPRVSWLFALWVGVLTLLTGPLLLINPLFIGWLQDRHDVADGLRLAQHELDTINGEIVWDIFSGGDFDATFSTGEPVLDADERAHMNDVSRLVRILVILDAVAIGFAAWGGRLLRTDPDRLGRMIMAGAGSVGVATVAIGLLAIFAWDTVFTLFHELLFPPGTWAFPPDSTMILLYPPEFWFEAAMIAGALVIATSAVLSFGGWRRVRETADSGE
jgi:integral membrane protein (TIGR01906 family)